MTYGDREIQDLVDIVKSLIFIGPEVDWGLNQLFRSSKGQEALANI